MNPNSIDQYGYHCNPKLSLPFIAIAFQKHFIALYHMGIYADPELQHWFVAEYPNYSFQKLDMGKSCIRFKKFDQIPSDLIAEFAKKIIVKQCINRYETLINKSK
ncbi:DUF1801 domain-containing protein [Flavobacterium sp. LB3P45]|uniref:DUF1801 domain-containing protein n=1 Tax=Flavobacterium fructosi TaxID=3230416 RepID=A0ABW6HS08_9FLAO